MLCTEIQHCVGHSVQSYDRCAANIVVQIFAKPGRTCIVLERRYDGSRLFPGKRLLVLEDPGRSWWWEAGSITHV